MDEEEADREEEMGQGGTCCHPDAQPAPWLSPEMEAAGNKSREEVRSGLLSL